LTTIPEKQPDEAIESVGVTKIPSIIASVLGSTPWGT